MDPSIRANLANSVLSKSPKFKILGLLTFDETDIHNLDLTPCTRSKILNGATRDKFRDARLGYTHDFERMSETTAYCRNILSIDSQLNQIDLSTNIFPPNPERGYRTKFEILLKEVFLNSIE